MTTNNDVNLAMLMFDAKTREMNFRHDNGLISDEEWKKYMLSENTLSDILTEIMPPLEMNKFSNIVL